MKPSSSALLAWCGSRRLPVLLAALILFPAPLDAQGAAGNEPNFFRIGLTFAGTSFVSLALEHQWGDQAAELSVGTISFRDVSVSLVGKQYFSGGTLRPFVGLGLWTMVAFQEQGTGAALIARAPLGVAWELTDDHFAGAEMNLNRALAIRRVDPEDQTPARTRIVPIPALIYRYRIDG